jgi:hypothetical protein
MFLLGKNFTTMLYKFKVSQPNPAGSAIAGAEEP